MAGFEPATLWSQTRCANRTALHPALPSETLAKEGFALQRLHKGGLSLFLIELVNAKTATGYGGQCPQAINGGDTRCLTDLTRDSDQGTSLTSSLIEL